VQGGEIHYAQGGGIPSGQAVGIHYGQGEEIDSEQVWPEVEFNSVQAVKIDSENAWYYHVVAPVKN
jgi:hypothetical protein